MGFLSWPGRQLCLESGDILFVYKQANIKLFTVYPLAYGRRICLCIRRVWWYMSLIWQHYYCSVMPIRPTIKKEKSFPYRCVKARTMDAWWHNLKLLTTQNHILIPSKKSCKMYEHLSFLQKTRSKVLRS